MRFSLYMLLGLLLLALASYRQFDNRVAMADRLRCEATLHADYADRPAALSALLRHCGEPEMVAMMEARRLGADPQQADAMLAAARRHAALSMLVNLALVGAGLGGFVAAWRVATGRGGRRRRHRR